MQETSTKPYFIRALYEWCTDNGYTPYITVAVTPRVRVPQEFVRDGQIVLNISFEATNALSIDNEAISFNARFGGVSREIHIPIGQVQAIYARENGHGMAFEIEPESDPVDETEEASEEEGTPRLAAVDKNQSTQSEEPKTPDDDPENQKKSKKPSLKIVK